MCTMGGQAARIPNSERSLAMLKVWIAGAEGQIGTAINEILDLSLIHI